MPEQRFSIKAIKSETIDVTIAQRDVADIIRWGRIENSVLIQGLIANWKNLRCPDTPWDADNVYYNDQRNVWVAWYKRNDLETDIVAGTPEDTAFFELIEELKVLPTAVQLREKQ